MTELRSGLSAAPDKMASCLSALDTAQVLFRNYYLMLRTSMGCAIIVTAALIKKSLRKSQAVCGT